MKNKRIIIILSVITVLLLIPLAAMQFTDEVVWTFFDFAVAGILLYSTGLTYEFVARRGGNFFYRAAFGAALASALILVWVNLAVGVIGSENNPVNLMYIGVLAVAFIGVVVARLRARGMSFALFATALAQALVAVIAVVIPLTSQVIEVLAVNGLFVFLFICSALLFWRAGVTDPMQKQQS
jgi:hypothetical protein